MSKRPLSKNQPSERRLKQYRGSSAENGVRMTVGMTGARAGDTLRGVEGMSSGDTANVLLRLKTGVVDAPGIIRRTIEDEIGREAVVAAFAKHFGISNSVAALRYADSPVDVDAANHRALGSGCNHSLDAECDCEPAATFTILSQGAWQEFAEAHGNGESLRAMVEEGRHVCWRDVLQLMQTPGQPGGKTLILRPRLFEIVCAPCALAADDPRLASGAGSAMIIECVPPWGAAAPADGGEVYELDSHLVRLPAPSPTPFGKADVTSAVLQAINGDQSGLQPSAVVASEVEAAINALAPLTAGGLKSCMQKAVRFHAAQVALGGAVTASAAVVAAVAAALLFASPGSFSPELQLFTRGGTAAFKRIAVILLEDAWIDDESTPAAVVALTASALSMQRIPSFEPSWSAVVAALRVLARAALSPEVIAWRKEDAKQRQAVVSIAAKQALQQAATLMRIVRSFPGDMDMFDLVAKLASRGSMPLRRASSQPTSMPLCHMVDQHCYRGIAHVMAASPRGGGDETFASRFGTIFDEVTGANPRRVDVSKFEERPAVRRVRFAQRCILPFVTSQPPRQPLPPPPASSKLASGGTAAAKAAADREMVISRRLHLDTGVLAAAVGPIKLKVRESSSSSSGGGGGGGGGSVRKERDVLVMLGVRAPEDEVVMLPPARATRDLFGSLSNEERADAIRQLRASPSLVARSPLLEHGHHTASFRDGCWHLDGEPWAEVVAKGSEMRVPLVAPPAWAADGALDLTLPLLKNDDALKEALAVTGIGCVPRAKNLVTALFASAPAPVALRAAGMLRLQYEKVSMPTPALSGGVGSDQLAAYAGDWDAYRLLVLLSRLAPGALQPAMPPTFRIPEPRLLRAVERWAMNGARLAGQAQGGGVADAEDAEEEEQEAEEAEVTTEATGTCLAVRATSSSSRENGSSSSAMDVEDGATAAAVLTASEAEEAEDAEDAAEPTNAWASHPRWRACGPKAEARLMEHQQVAVERMEQRDGSADTGHFLILDTGMGKTVTSLVYAWRWLQKNGGSVRRILWVTPAGTIDNLLAQLRRTWGVPVFSVPRLSTAKQPKPGELSYLKLEDYAVNVIHADHLRTAIDKGLAQQATKSFLIFDEVDEMYAPTLRTSAARALRPLPQIRRTDGDADAPQRGAAHRMASRHVRLSRDSGQHARRGKRHGEHPAGAWRQCRGGRGARAHDGRCAHPMPHAARPAAVARHCTGRAGGDG